MTGAVQPAGLSFVLLARELKEAILGNFDLPTIARYFPDYREAMRRRFAD